jgi:hypothetical protein
VDAGYELPLRRDCGSYSYSYLVDKYSGAYEGICFSGLDYLLDDDNGTAITTAAECWGGCVDMFGHNEIVAVNWFIADQECYCQDGCVCMQETDSTSLLIQEGYELPAFCENYNTTFSNSSYDIYNIEEYGWCYSDLDYQLDTIFETPTAADCWDGCYEVYGDDLVAIDFYSSNESCYCQDDCTCLDDIGDNGTLLVVSGYEIPSNRRGCGSYSYSYLVDKSAVVHSGYCTSGLDYYLNIGNGTGIECWGACVDMFGHNEIVAIDYWKDDQSCWCQDDCFCMESGDDATLIVQADYELPIDCEDMNITFSNSSYDNYTVNAQGWCYSDLDFEVTWASSASECWSACINLFGADDIVAVDFYPSDESCYCQDDCSCLDDIGDNGTLLVVAGYELPSTRRECGSYSYSYLVDKYSVEDEGWCYSSLDYYMGNSTESAAECWGGCVDMFGHNEIVAIDFYPDDQTCYCQDDCFCMASDDSGTLFVQADYELPIDCEDMNITFSNSSYDNYTVNAQGWCYSDLDFYVSWASSASECWSACINLFGADDIVAIDFYPSDESCFCQDDCNCMADIGDNGTLLVDAGYELPNECSIPTPAPTIVPTSGDTVTVSVSVSLNANAEPTAEDESGVKSTIASQIGLSETTIRNFEITSTSDSRRQLLAYVWDVAFDVVASLSEVGATSGSSFTSTIQSDLSESSFETSLTSAVDSVTSVDSVSSSLTTDSPTAAPTSKSKNSSSSSSSFATLNIILICVGGVVLIGGAVGLFIWSQRSMEDKQEDTLINGEAEQELSPAEKKKMALENDTL